MSIRLEARCSQATPKSAPPSKDLFYLAESTFSHELTDLTDCRNRTVLGSRLEDAAISAYLLHESATLANCYRDGLLAIDVFARLGSVNRLQGVPVVRGHDDDGIYIRSGQELTIVIISCAAAIGAAGALGGVGFLNATFPFFSPQTVYVTYGQYLDVPVTNQAA